MKNSLFDFWQGFRGGRDRYRYRTQGSPSGDLHEDNGCQEQKANGALPRNLVEPVKYLVDNYGEKIFLDVGLPYKSS